MREIGFSANGIDARALAEDMAGGNNLPFSDLDSPLETIRKEYRDTFIISIIVVLVLILIRSSKEVLLALLTFISLSLDAASVVVASAIRLFQLFIYTFIPWSMEAALFVAAVALRLCGRENYREWDLGEKGAEPTASGNALEGVERIESTEGTASLNNNNPGSLEGEEENRKLKVA